MGIPGQSISLPYPFPDIKSGTWDAFALLRNLQFLASKITAIEQGQLMPSGGIIMLRSGSSCPTGYNKVTDAGLANRYLRINTSSGGGTGGSLTVAITDSGHTHGVGTYVTNSKGAHTHTNTGPSSTTTVMIGAGSTVASSTHIHTINSTGAHTHGLTGASASKTTGISGTIAPTFLDVILCQKV